MTQFKQWCIRNNKNPSHGSAVTEYFKLNREVKIALIDRGMTQTQLAFKLGVTKQNLNNVIQGRSKSLQLEEKIEEWLKDENNNERN